MLKTWTKSITCPDGLGKDPVTMLEEAIQRIGVNVTNLRPHQIIFRFSSKFCEKFASKFCDKFGWVGGLYFFYFSDCFNEQNSPERNI